MGSGAYLLYVLADAARSVRENLATTVFTSVTLGFSLAIFSLFLIVFVNLNGVMERWGERSNVVVYLDGASSEAPGKKAGELSAIEGVREVRFISREDALAELKKELKGHEGVLEGLDANPLPASFEVGLEEAALSGGGVEKVVRSIRSLEWVDEVQYSREWVEKFSAFVGFIQLSALMVGVFLAVATVFIISNTIRLTVYARRDEIEIMKLVGASNAFVKAPFFVEGMVQGALGGALAMGILFLGRALLAARIPPYLDFTLEVPLSPVAMLFWLVVSGVVMGTVGSLVSMARFLKA